MAGEGFTTTRSATHDIIVIGASLGGVEAVTAIAAALPEDLQAAILIVIHTSPHTPGRLAAVINRAGPLRARYPEHGEVLDRNVIYVAPPDNHIILKSDRISVVRGPKENFTRPAVDPLFRSAALSYGPRVVGVVLTGGLDDGTAGLLAIKALGGVAVVQDPNDARDPSMPSSALEHVQVDHCLPLKRIPRLLADLSQRAASPANQFPVPPWLAAEEKIAEATTMQGERKMEKVGSPSPLSCPECGGVLYEMELGKLLRYRCRTGHAYSGKSLMADQLKVLEDTLWAGTRSLEESALMLERLAERVTRRNGVDAAKTLRALAEERRRQADEMRRLVEFGLAEAPSP